VPGMGNSNVTKGRLDSGEVWLKAFSARCDRTSSSILDSSMEWTMRGNDTIPNTNNAMMRINHA
jgi:hypothetical protein